MTSLELHVWSRAFGLPSFDPECLSTIALLQSTMPDGSWSLIESNNTALSPSSVLPALKDGEHWVSGFSNIAKYISNKSHGRLDLDDSLSPQEIAQSTAYSSFITNQAIPLIALSLYVTPANYINVTRPVYSKFLPFPVQYRIPIQHHKLAFERTAHLPWAATGLNLENDKRPPVSSSLATLATSGQEPKADGKESITTRLRLESLVRDFLAPIQKKIDGQDTFFGKDSVSTVDCLLVGYLSLCLYPELPSSWLGDTIKRDYPEICKYLTRHRMEMFPEEGLPIKEADEQQALTASGWLKDTLASAVVFSHIAPSSHGESNEGKSEEEKRSEAGLARWDTIRTIATVGVAGGAWLLYFLLTSRAEVNVKSIDMDNEKDNILGTAITDIGIESKSRDASGHAISNQSSATDLGYGLSAHDLLGL